MPLPRYGVAIGNLVRFYRDPPDNFGRWYHGHIEVSTPSGTWTSALDVDTPTGLGIRYRVSGSLQKNVLGGVATLAPGFHFLGSNSTSGALDYIRSPFLQDHFLYARMWRPPGLPKRLQALPPPLAPMEPPRWRPRPPVPDSLKEAMLRLLSRVGYRLPERFVFQLRPWLQSNGDNALKALEAELTGNRRTYIFGERFNSGQGVHDVHQNQGDPQGSQWWSQNGIWQDGGVAVERTDGSLFFWQVRFNSQATATDNNGHPA